MLNFLMFSFCGIALTRSNLTPKLPRSKVANPVRDFLIFKVEIIVVEGLINPFSVEMLKTLL